MKTLIEEISSEDNLKTAWHALNRSNDDSFGLSGETIREFEQDLEKNIAVISKELKGGEYEFSPSRAAIIPKSNGKFRPLQIPEVKDRIVLKSIALALERDMKGIIELGEGVSFAYQKGLGVRDAVLQMQKNFNDGKGFVLKADIKDFFNEIDENKLLSEKVFPNLKDKSLDSLLQKALSQQVGGVEKLKKKKHRELFSNNESGIPQGNPL